MPRGSGAAIGLAIALIIALTNTCRTEAATLPHITIDFFDDAVPVAEQVDIHSEIHSVISWDEWPDHVDSITVRVGDVFCAIACYSSSLNRIDIKYREGVNYAGSFAHEYTHALQAKWQSDLDLYNKWETESIATFVGHKYESSMLRHACGVRVFDPDAPEQYALASFWRTAGASLSMIHAYYAYAEKFDRERALEHVFGYTYEDAQSWLDDQNDLWCADDQLSVSHDIGDASCDIDMIRLRTEKWDEWQSTTNTYGAPYRVTVTFAGSSPVSFVTPEIYFRLYPSYADSVKILLELLSAGEAVCSRELL